MPVHLCSSKKCVNRNMFGYCMLSGPCEHPELLVNTTFDNKTSCNEGQIKKSKDEEM